MPLCVVHICGPNQSGKTDLAKRLARSLAPDRPHHLHMVKWDGRGPQGFTAVAPMDGMFESRRCTYLPERIFEQLPAALRAIKQTRRWATVLLETDCDPCHRQSYEYDVRVFVSHAPSRIDEVFRSPAEANRIMNSIMHDSYLFAQEVYGLAPDATLDESRLGVAAMSESNGSTRSLGPMTDTDMGRLLSSDIGQELASRLQLQPSYYPVVDSDVVVLNTARGSAGSTVDDVARRIEALQGRRVLTGIEHGPMLAVCDLTDDTDPMQRSAITRVAELVAGVTANWP